MRGAGVIRFLLRHRPLLAALVCVLGAPFAARADEPALRLGGPLPGGDTNLLGVHAARALEVGRVSLGLMGDYASQPLVGVVGGEERAFIEHRVLTDFLLSVGLGAGLELGLDLPLAAYQSGDVTPTGFTPAARFALGDVRIVPK